MSTIIAGMNGIAITRESTTHTNELSTGVCSAWIWPIALAKIRLENHHVAIYTKVVPTTVA